jgi:predicted nucleic acid-binding protein
MRRLFVDTFYLVALLYRRDAWHDRAVAFSQTLTSDDALLTTDAILVENRHFLPHECPTEFGQPDYPQTFLD